ncbi:zeta toxin family protein [Pedobacter namyangjuensis]|uniref:zeta toxin family protein n=1 Tax=Pedobacter namyangjuensis TaxID=600626 RepID=UPI000DE460C2|nr:toxin [Pedobacter namyangjuensis]
MSPKPKLRIFAGPNGSGKTTLFDSIQSIYFSTRLFINADNLEQFYKKTNFINLSDFEISCTKEQFDDFCLSSGLYKKAGFDEQSWNLALRSNVIVNANGKKTVFNSYHFAIIADFIRHVLIQNKQSFSFETVFSHPSKLDLIDFAHQNNYKVYLYFIGTETPIMNLERVKDRVKKGGHAVEGDKVEKRYFLTMGLLADMIKKADETYLWDNSGLKHKFIGKLKDGYGEFEQLSVPGWVKTYILDKV